MNGERSRWKGDFLTVSSRHIDRHSHWEETVRTHTHTPSHSVFMKRIRSIHCILKTQGRWIISVPAIAGETVTDRTGPDNFWETESCYCQRLLPYPWSSAPKSEYCPSHGRTHSGRTDAAVKRASCLSTSAFNVCLFIFTSFYYLIYISLII